MTNKQESRWPRWVVMGPVVDEGKRSQSWTVQREGDPYQHQQFGKMGTQRGEPFGHFISRKWAEQTAQFANDLEDALAAAQAALTKINAIRNSIVEHQTVNWSAHIYPLVAALNEAGYEVDPAAVDIARGGAARTPTEKAEEDADG